MTPMTWADVKPGSTVTVKHVHRVRPFKMQVAMVERLWSHAGKESAFAFVTGRRLRMDGTPSTLPSNELKGVRRELVHIQDVTAIEKPPRTLNSDGKRARGTSNGNQRGGSAARRRRKAWLLKAFGDGEKAPCAFQCGAVLDMATVTVDRFPIPGAQGGTYARGNIRPVCGGCNSRHGATVRRSR